MTIHFYIRDLSEIHRINDDFGAGSYNQTSLASIMLNYWRSAAAVHYLVECCYGGDVMKVFSKYEEWHENGRQQPLTEYFGVEAF